MKTIKIEGKDYNLESSAFSYIKYQSIFKSSMTKDLQFMQVYLAKQHLYAEKLKESKLSDEEIADEISKMLIDETDQFIRIITQFAWIMMYTADDKIEDYDTFLKSLKNFKISDKWISEVTELAVDCFC